MLSGRGLCDELIIRPEESYGVWLVRDLYLTTHNTHSRQTSMPPVVFEPTLPASERPQSHALDRAATGFDSEILCVSLIFRQSVDYVLFTGLTDICATAECK